MLKFKRETPTLLEISHYVSIAAVNNRVPTLALVHLVTEGKGQIVLTIFYKCICYLCSRKTFRVILPTLGFAPLKSVGSSPRTFKIEKYGDFPLHKYG